MQRRPKHPWLKWRGYPHFGSKLNRQHYSLIKNYVANEDQVAKHKFYPLIRKNITERRYGLIKSDEGKPYRLHNEKCRNIFYASHLDAHLLSYYANVVLGIPYEQELRKQPDINSAVLAYRVLEKENKRGKNNVDFAKEVFDLINIKLQNEGECAAIAFDISSFFDSLDHTLLLEAWVQLLDLPPGARLPEHHYTIYKFVTNIAFVWFQDCLKVAAIKHPKEIWKNEIETFSRNHKEFRRDFAKKGKINPHPFFKENTRDKVGIAQGTPISAFLSNLYMLSFDKWAVNTVNKIGGVYRRYSDDIAIICSPEYVDTLKDLFVNEIHSFCKLTIKEAKTQVSLFYTSNEGIQCRCSKSGNNKPFQYLGFEYDGNRVLIRQSSISKFYRKMITSVRIRCKRVKRLNRYYIPSMTSTTPVQELFKGPLYNRYSEQGKSGSNRNYHRYASEAARTMGNPKIKKQLRRSWSILHEAIDKHHHNGNKSRVSLKKSDTTESSSAYSSDFFNHPLYYQP